MAGRRSSRSARLCTARDAWLSGPTCETKIRYYGSGWRSYVSKNGFSRFGLFMRPRRSLIISQTPNGRSSNHGMAERQTSRTWPASVDRHRCSCRLGPGLNYDFCFAFPSEAKLDSSTSVEKDFLGMWAYLVGMRLIWRCIRRGIQASILASCLAVGRHARRPVARTDAASNSRSQSRPLPLPSRPAMSGHFVRHREISASSLDRKSSNIGDVFAPLKPTTRSIVG